MFGSLNNLAHHCSVASFPPCWAMIPYSPIARPVDAELSCAPEGCSDVPSCRMRKRMREKRGIASLDGPRQQQGIVSHVEKTRERDGNESDQPPFLIFSPRFISGVSFLFAADKQHWLIYEHGCVDATSSHPDEDGIQTLQKIHQVLERTIESWWIASCEENADVFFLKFGWGSFAFSLWVQLLTQKLWVQTWFFWTTGANVGSSRITIFSFWNSKKCRIFIFNIRNYLWWCHCIFLQTNKQF